MTSISHPAIIHEQTEQKYAKKRTTVLIGKILSVLRIAGKSANRVVPTKTAFSQRKTATTTNPKQIANLPAGLIFGNCISVICANYNTNPSTPTQTVLK